VLLWSCTTAPKKIEQVKSSQQEDIIGQIVSAMVNQADKLPNRTVAVIEFSDIEGKGTAEGKLYAERIITGLVTEGTLKVIERSQVEKILSEQKLELTGIIDADSAKQAGRLLGVDAIITGTIAKLYDFNELNARMIDTEKGIILAAVTVKEPITDILQHPTTNIPEEEIHKIEQERRELLELKKTAPERFRAIIQRRKKLIELRKRDPELFYRVVNLPRFLSRLAKTDPEKFLILTHPRWRRRHPILFRKLKTIRDELKLLKEHFPDKFEEIDRLKDELLKERKLKRKF
jgi:TolB-like protein